jgi:hypothetical protein
MIQKFALAPASAVLISLAGQAQAAVLEAERVIATSDVNFTGKTVGALTVNGSIAGPTL